MKEVLTIRNSNLTPLEILLVEDNPGDVRLITEAFKNIETTVNIDVAKDGFEAMQILNREGNYSNSIKPQLILLDLNLPKKNGREVLKEIKSSNYFQCRRRCN